jgi:hypothetical protein
MIWHFPSDNCKITYIRPNQYTICTRIIFKYLVVAFQDELERPVDLFLVQIRSVMARQNDQLNYFL